MSILLYVMVLAYLYGIQATNMDNSRQGQQQQRQQPSPDPLNSLIIQLLQADLTRGRTRGSQGPPGRGWDAEPQDTLPPLDLPVVDLPEEDEEIDAEQQGTGGGAGGGLIYQPITSLNSDLLKQHRRYSSPRVLLSDRAPLQPPPLYVTDDFAGGGGGGLEGGGGAAGNKTRKRRYAEHKSYRGEYSVCDSVSDWVTNKTHAVDIQGRTVTVLAEIKTSSAKEVKQYFYETRCQTNKPFKSGCRGINDKHWNSQCKTTQTMVRALTQDHSKIGWRWIRINTSCVCALSRKRHRT